MARALGVRLGRDLPPAMWDRDDIVRHKLVIDGLVLYRFAVLAVVFSVVGMPLCYDWSAIQAGLAVPIPAVPAPDPPARRVQRQRSGEDGVLVPLQGAEDGAAAVVPDGVPPHFAAMDRAELMHVAARALALADAEKARADELAAALRNSRRNHARLQRVVAKRKPLNKKRMLQAATHAVGFDQNIKKGRAEKHLSINGAFCMVLRRCMSNLSAQSLGLAFMADVHRSTVTRWEVRFRAALVMAARRFHSTCRARLATDPAPSIGWRLQLHVVRGDATNSAVWQKCCLRVAQ
eukprot:264186-Pyramimonas_sp.AAC.1